MIPGPRPTHPTSERGQLRAHLRSLDAEYVGQAVRYAPVVREPVYDGDPCDEPVGARYPRWYLRDELASELFDRHAEVTACVVRTIRSGSEWGSARRSEIMRRTHPAIHRALAGETGDAVGAPGCRWCREAAR